MSHCSCAPHAFALMENWLASFSATSVGGEALQWKCIPQNGTREFRHKTTTFIAKLITILMVNTTRALKFTISLKASSHFNIINKH